MDEEEIAYFVDDMHGSIGRRYTRNDEIGIKYAIVLDHATLADGETITVRERDCRKQIKIQVRIIYLKTLTNEVLEQFYFTKKRITIKPAYNNNC